ncbi:hypothetical protein ABIB15_001398 [Marisediminicola sp. UYEF4]|uniref:hypothetical protein n=1 Tax=Marisediminicola sp. UYEF4 TaxID=1756384 RepID=UPI003392E64B
MTVWHDQPPLSRRQVRENSPTDTDESAIADESAAGENPPRRSAGRRVQWDPSAETPAPGSNARSAVESDAETAPSRGADAPGEDNPAGYRARDYRPDIRRAVFAPITAGAPQDPWSPPEDPAGTIGEPERAALPTELAAPEYTMTRRALRELRQRAEAAGQEAPNVVRDANGALALTGSIPVIDLPRDDDGQIAEEVSVTADAEHDAPPDAELDAADPESVIEQPVEEQSTAEHTEPEHERIPVDVIVAEQALASAIIDEATISEATIIEVDGAEAADGADGQVESDGFDGDTVISTPVPLGVPIDVPIDGTTADATGSDFDTVHALIEPDAPERFEAQPQAGPQPESLSPFDALFLAPSSEARPVNVAPPLLEHDGGRGVEPAPDAAPYGHWSTQAALDDASQSNEAMLSRNVGHATGAITTHALVLPSAPSSGDRLLTAVTATGEIMVTGSIDLPRSFGSTGAHPALFDHPDVDALIDESDREDAVSESAPVRAIRAVSSNSSTRGVIEAPAPRKSRLPLIAGITGGSALLVAAGVVVAGFIFNVF